jgi:acyl carrier protein
MSIDSTIRDILRDHARLNADPDSLSDDSDLYRAGLTSHNSISLMLAIEDAFDLELPATAMRKSTFASMSAIRQVLIGLGVDPSAPVER